MRNSFIKRARGDPVKTGQSTVSTPSTDRLGLKYVEEKPAGVFVRNRHIRGFVAWDLVRILDT